jgi:prepilin-type processing-associated H-X9-DG protein
MRRKHSRRGRILARVLEPATALLATLLLAFAVISAFRKPEFSAKRPHCWTNLRQLGIGMSMYCSDFDGRYPSAGSWQDVTVSYVAIPQSYVCPDRPQTKPGYAFNQCMDRIAMQRVLDPIHQPLLFESGSGRRNSTDPLTSFLTPHEGTGNICFSDGHVGSFTKAPAADAGLQKDHP